ncbi:PL29 family lyase N-terminal domain-containing protein [Phocaeicola sp.]
MNKKFLSAILFGALMVTSTGTFVSCKDYDDDIDRIDNTLNDLKSKLDALQTKVDAGKYVTNVATTADGITITLSDGTSYPITNGKDGDKGEAGAAGDKVEISEDGFFIINGKTTEWKAVAKDAAGQTIKIKAPTVAADGTWVFYDEKGEPQSTTIKVAPVTAVQNEDKTWTLTVWDADGKSQTIKLPTAASMITEAEVLGYLYTSTGAYTADGYWYPIAEGVSNYNVIPYNFSIVGNLTDAQTKWNKETGVKKLVKGQALSTIASYRSNLMVRIAPAALDASELSLSLVNSKLANAPIVLGTPETYTGLLTRAAVSGNGLWTIPVSAEEGKTYKDEAAYLAQFQINDMNYDGTVNNTNLIAFALQEKGGFTTSFDLSFERNTNLSLTTGLQDYYNVELNEETSVRFYTPANVYDAHIHFSDADVIRWGIVYNGGIDFTIAKLADQITVPSISATVHYVTMDGQVHETPITIKPSKVNANMTELAKNTISVKADNSKNNFTADLTPMFNNLGTTATTLWRADVKTQSIEFYKVKSGDEMYDTEIANYTTQVAVSYDKAALGEINKIKVALAASNTLSRFENYYLIVNYFDNSGEVLSTLKVPFNITIPTLTSLLNKEKVVFGGTANGTGVMNENDLNENGDAIYSLKYAFNKLSDAFAGNTQITFGIDANQTIKVDGNDVKMRTLATVNAPSTKDASIQLTDKKNAYNKAINMVVTSASYLGKYAYTADELKTAAFTMKVVSPIEQGTLEAAAGADAIINVVATEDGTAKVSESDLVAKTYAGVAYKVFKDKFNGAELTASAWTTPYIKADASFESTNTNVFTMGSVNAATRTDKGVVTPGYVVVKPMNVAYEDAVPVKITVVDAWGYKKEATIKVKVSPKK